MIWTIFQAKNVTVLNKIDREKAQMFHASATSSASKWANFFHLIEIPQRSI